MLKQEFAGRYPERIKIPVLKGKTITSSIDVNGFSDQFFETNELEGAFVEASFVKQQGSWLVYVTEVMYPWEYFENGRVSRNFTPADRTQICKLWFDCDDVKVARCIDKSDLASMSKEQILDNEPYWLNSAKEEQISFYHRVEGVTQDRYEEYEEHKVIPIVDETGKTNYQVVVAELTGEDAQSACLRAVLYLDPENIQTYKA